MFATLPSPRCAERQQLSAHLARSAVGKRIKPSKCVRRSSLRLVGDHDRLLRDGLGLDERGRGFRFGRFLGGAGLGLLALRHLDRVDTDREEDGEGDRHHEHGDRVVAGGEDRRRDEDDRGRLTPVLDERLCRQKAHQAEGVDDERKLEARAESEHHLQHEEDERARVLVKVRAGELAQVRHEPLERGGDDGPGECRAHDEQAQAERGQLAERLPLLRVQRRSEEAPNLQHEQGKGQHKTDHEAEPELQHERLGGVLEDLLVFDSRRQVGPHRRIDVVVQEAVQRQHQQPADDPGDDDDDDRPDDPVPQFLQVLDQTKAEILRIVHGDRANRRARTVHGLIMVGVVGNWGW